MKALHNTPNVIANPAFSGMKKSLAQTRQSPDLSGGGRALLLAMIERVVM